MNIKKFITLVLASISITGIVGIPMGDPQFFAEAIGLEFVFVTLMILSIKKIRLALIPNIVIGIIVMVGNSISSQHIEIMSSLSPMGMH